MTEPRRPTVAQEIAAATAVAVACFGAFLKLGGVVMVDLRYQDTLTVPPGVPAVAGAAGCAVLVTAVLWKWLAAAGWRRHFFRLCRPLLLLAVFYFIPAGFASIAGAVLVLAFTVGRVAAAAGPPLHFQLRWRTVFATVGVAALLWAVAGAAIQYYAHSRLAMQWFDWGHYFEALNNCFKGRPFYLNLEHGSFLGSRFCPGLIVLLPVVMLQSEFCFFLTGSLLLGSGAVIVAGIGRSMNFTPAQSLGLAAWYLLIPGLVNMNVPLVDGFHEVYMLFPAVLGAVWCCLERRYAAAVLLALFSCLVRETVPFFWIGMGGALFLRGRRRTGLAVAVGAALAAVLIFKVAMPYFGGGRETYVHTSFFPQLGSGMMEIALSPLIRPGVFWGGLFSLHNLQFWLTLLPPFLWTGVAAPWWWLGMAPDFLMVASDCRFDSQTVLRHYQTIMLLAMMIAALDGFRRLREGNGVLIRKLLGSGAAHPAAGALAAMLVTAGGFTFFYTQFPGMAAQDRRLYDWSDARPLLSEFIAAIPPGTAVSAGPRIAGHLVMRNEIFFDWLPEKNQHLEKYVFIEGTSTMYGESALRNRLLKSPDWRVLRSAMLDERQLILFEHAPGGAPAPAAVRSVPEEEWLRFGAAVPCRLPGVELRAAWLPEGIFRLAARIGTPQSRDFGLRIELTLTDGSHQRTFVLFGHGLASAETAAVGDTAVYDFRLPAPPRVCRITPVVVR